MLEHIHAVLKKECLLDPGQVVLVGVSGGPDSLCLLDLMWRMGYQIVVAHLDHGLRSEAGVEAQAVNRMAETMGIPFRLGRMDVSAFSEEYALSIEEAARTVRYHFLFEQAAQCKAQAVAVGHTADDQVETVLMHLLRGAGLSGLRGMSYRSLPNPWSNEIPLVRPLLGVWREQVMKYITERGLQPNMDASNLDIRYFRNRLRNELVPYLESYNPSARKNLWRTAEMLHLDFDLVEKLVDTAWQTCVTGQDENFISFNRHQLGDHPIGIQRHLIRRGINRLRPGLRDIDYEATRRTLRFLQTPSRSGQLDLMAGLRLVLEGERLWLVRWEADLPTGEWPQIPANDELELIVPGETQLSEHWLLHADVMPCTQEIRQQATENPDPFQTWMDYDILKLPLRVRARHPGDRFQPLGMEGHSIKLSDFMINVKLPTRARYGWPLVCSSDTIVWVPGFRLAHPFRISATTTRLARLWLTREKTSI